MPVFNGAALTIRILNGWFGIMLVCTLYLRTCSMQARSRAASI